MIQVEGFDKVFAIADEDLERATSEKTSAVHFLRFELDKSMIAALRQQAASLKMGCDHQAYRYTLTAISGASRNSLLNDFN